MCRLACSRALPELVDSFSQHSLAGQKAPGKGERFQGFLSIRELDLPNQSSFVCMFYKIRVMLLYKKSMLCFPLWALNYTNKKTAGDHLNPVIAGTKPFWPEFVLVRVDE